MANLAHITVETKPAHGIGAPALYEWPQPFLNGDDALDWFTQDAVGTATAGTTRKVQRDRLTDEVYWCSVLTDLGGSSSFVVTTGPAQSPATGWTAPDLTGLKLRFTWAAGAGGDGSIHDADLTDTGKRDILRDGHNVREERRYVMTKVTTVGTGNLVIGEGVLCVHAYFTFRADLPNVVKLALRISNAAAEVQTDAASLAARGGGIKSTGTTQLNTIGFSDCDLILPTVGTWACIQERKFISYADDTIICDASEIPPVAGAITSNAHAFPRKMATTRRFVLYKTSAGATLQQAQDLMALKGFGRADDGGHGIQWRNYHTIPSWGPTKSRLPRLDLGFNDLGFGPGYTAAQGRSVQAYNTLKSAVSNGTATYSGSYGTDGNAVPEFGTACTARNFGLFQFVGSDDVEEPGGADIGPMAGAVRHIPSYARFAMLYGALKCDGSALYLYERTTGKPLRSYDFAAAYAGGAVAGTDANYTGGASFAGIRQPFGFTTETIGGYEYRGAGQEDFAGWTKRDNSWPPHEKSNPSWSQGGKAKWLPKRTSLWGTAPRSIWSFVCNYWPLLEYVPYSAAPDAGTPIVYDQPKSHFLSAPTSSGTSTGECWKDPEDKQHMIRTFRYLIPAIWLAGDLMSIDTLHMTAEFYSLQFSEMGFLLNGESNDTRSALACYTINNTTPGTAAKGNGRGEAWAMYLNAAQFATASVTERDTGYPVYGIKSRARFLYDQCRLCVIPSNGMTTKYRLGDNVTLTAGTGVTLRTYGIDKSSNASGNGNAYLTIPQDINGTGGDIADGSISGRINRQPGTTVLTFTGANWTQATRRLTHASFAAYGPASGDVSGIASAGDYDGPFGQVIPVNYLVMQAGNELSKVVFGYFALYKQLSDANNLPAASVTQSLDHYVTMWREYAGREFIAGNPQTAYIHVGGTYSPANWVAIWNQTTGQPEPGTTLFRGPQGTEEHWQDVCSFLECAYRANGDVNVLLSANRIAGQVAAGTTPAARAPAILNANPDYAPGLVNLMQFQPGADSAATVPHSNPQVQVSANPNPVVQGQTTTITAVVTPGMNPTSTGIRCYLNLSGFGLGAAVEIFEAVAGDNHFLYTFDSTPYVPQSQTVACSVTDAQGGAGFQNFPLTVASAATAPTVSVQIQPFPVPANQPVTLYATVVAGTSPTSTGLVVTADLSAFGLSATTPMLNDGVAPDVSAADLIFTLRFTPTTQGRYTVPISVVDAQLRTASTLASLSVSAPVVVATNPQVIASVDHHPLRVGDTVVVHAVVTPGINPPSTGLTVTMNAAAIGQSSNLALLDDGIAPDVGASDFIYTASFVLGAVADGNYSLPVTVADDQGRTGGDRLLVTVQTPVATNPTIISLTIAPNPAVQGDNVVFTAIVTGGTGAIASVVITGLGTINLVDRGGGVWNASLATTLATAPSTYALTATATDSVAATGTYNVGFTLNPHAPTTQGTATLVVRDGSMVFLVPLNAAERLEVDGLEIQSSPNATAQSGGQLPVTLEDGTTVVLVPFRITTPPVDPPPGPITIGDATGGPRQTRPAKPRERGH